MKILITGKGGREHALAWKFAQNNTVSQIFIAEGNPACELVDKVKCVKLKTIDELLEFALAEQIGLTFVGSEDLLVAGIVDVFSAKGLRIFGPNKLAAQLEGSKVFSKDFMQKYGVKTAKYQNFYDYDNAVKYLDEVSYPIVVKASGLAAGKGVIIAQSYDEAHTALKEMFIDKVFGESGLEVVIEEFLVGVEASILSFTDSKVILPFISAKDHKKIGEGETGLNTGGMGVIAPNPYVTKEVHQAFTTDILEPTLKGLQAEKMDFAGVIFFGVMITANGVYLLEYNMRMGDPETEAVLPLMQSDLLDAVNMAIDRNLSSANIQWSNEATCCVVLASGGYPEKFPTGIEISGIENFATDSCELFAAGVAKADGKFVTSGGRVINIVGRGHNLDEARNIAYRELNKIKFDGSYYRKDIGVISK